MLNSTLHQCGSAHVLSNCVAPESHCLSLSPPPPSPVWIYPWIGTNYAEVAGVFDVMGLEEFSHA